MEYKYKISIIIPFYNSEQYLEDAINSVIGQSIGFENIQLILVNDGSTDNSEEIAVKYKKIYDNIILITQENRGVSSARNSGLKYADGKYINFLDSDDKWSKDALLNMYNYIEEHENEIDFISARVKCFEANTDYHFLDYKFEETRVIDIEKEPDMIIMHVASTLFKSSLIKELRFDTKLKIAEDSVFVNKILIKRLRYGVCREAVYNYRKRISGNSTIQNISKNRTWYFDTPMYAWQTLIDESKKKHNKIIDYIQYVLIYELKWRINCQYTILNCLEVREHLEIIKNTAKQIDIDKIEKYRLLSKEEKDIFMKLKEI